MKMASSIGDDVNLLRYPPFGLWLWKWLAGKAPRSPVQYPAELERYLHEESVPMRQRLSVAKQVLRWAKGLEAEQLAEIVEFMDQLESESWPAHS